MKRILACLFFCFAAVLDPGTAAAQTQEAALEAVAAAVRQRGHSCAEPRSVEHDAEHSSPDEKAWIIRCENATYRVTFKGDTGADVERLD